MAADVRRAWRGTAAAAAALALAAGCGDDDGTTAVSNTTRPGTSPPTVTATASSPPPTDAPEPASSASSSSSSSSSTSSVAESDPDQFEGVVVAVGQTMAEPYPWWWVIDLKPGETIANSSRVFVEVTHEEIGCGDDFLPVFAMAIDAGEEVSFEVVAGDPGPPPEFWMTRPDVSYEPEPAVRGRRLRVTCPEGADAAAAELAAQRAIWDERGPDSYEFSLTWHVFNTTYGQYQIGVVDGEAVSIVKDGSTRLDPSDLEGDLPLTIDELFDELARHLGGDAFVARYDDELGFPTSVEVDQMANAVDDELEVRVGQLVPGVPAAVVDQPLTIGQRVEATAIDWSSESPDGVSFWLVVDAAGGVTVDGSSRLSLQVPVGEVRCGAELRPIDTLESLEGPATVSFEVTALPADAPPGAGPTTASWPSVSGRQLQIPVCPPTVEDLVAELEAARARWEAAGIDDYEMDLSWGPLGPEWTRHRITVVDGQTTSIVTLDENERPGGPEVDPGVLAALPGTVEEIFAWLAVEVPAQELTVHYDPADGHPRGAFGGWTAHFDMNLRPTGG